MARRKDSASESPRLTVPRSQLAAELDERVAAGEALLARPIPSVEEFKNVQRDYFTWDEYNRRLLKSRFTSSDIEEEYSASGPLIGFGGPTSLEDEIKDLHEDISQYLRRLRSVKDQLPLYEEPPMKASASVPSVESRTTIFVVHGHDEERKAALTVFLRQVTKLDVVVLHEKANRGRTIIEKFEEHAARAAYAVVLLTADDDGGPAGSSERRRRARQNVVFELGFFIGVLGRSRVTVLYEEGVELPSDVSGVLYVPLDGKGAWKFELGRELKEAQIEVDLNKAL